MRQSFFFFFFFLFLAALENSVFPMGCDSLHEIQKIMSVVYKRHLRAETKHCEWRSELTVIKCFIQCLL